MIKPGETFLMKDFLTMGRVTRTCAIVPFLDCDEKQQRYYILDLKSGEMLGHGTLDEVYRLALNGYVCRVVSHEEVDRLAEQKAKEIMAKYVEGIFNDDGRQSYETLARKIINRFTKIGIVSADNAKTQFMKVTEELGELAEGINKDKAEQVKDSLGDVLVTLILLAEDLNLNLLDCLSYAWNEIKDRKGEVKDGSFVKEADLNVQDKD